jgi:WD40 repeat protein
MVALRRAAIAIFLLAASCGFANLDAHDVPTHRIPTAKGEYAGIAWLSSGWIVASFNPHPGTSGNALHLVMLQPDGSSFQPIEVPGDPACSLIRYLEPTALPDGRVAFLSECSLPEGPRPFEDRLLAYDLSTKVTSPLVPGLLPPQAGAFTWNPAMDHGLFGGLVTPCVSIAGFTPQGVEYLPITVSEGERSWRLDQLFLGPSTSDCQKLGNANWPAWAPDGLTIAFFASPAAIGHDGIPRLDAPWNLYFMGGIQQSPRQVLKSVFDPQDLKWSPDGKWLAFGGKIGGKAGTWLYNPASHRLERVAADVMNALAWSPDGRQIAAVLQTSVDIGSLENELLFRCDLSQPYRALT